MSSSREQLANKRTPDATPARAATSNGKKDVAPAKGLLSPHDFYRRLAGRPDVSKILERLAK